MLDLPGAIAPPDGGPDAGIPWHFGDPFAEQRAAARGVSIVDRSNRGLIAVTGEDRLSWLHLVISQHVTELADGAATEALVLDSQGRAESHFELAHVDGTVWLDTDPNPMVTSARNQPQQLLEYLDSMRFWSKVEVRDATAERAVLSLVGPDTAALLEKLGLSLPAGVSGGEVIVRRMPWPGADLLVPRQDLRAWWDRLTEAGAKPMGSMGFEAFRVALLRPRIGLDTDDRTIPHEAGWVPGAAHVAKVHNIGRPPRLMVLLHLDGSAESLPATGDPVRQGERVVGRVGTVAQHHELGPIALALIKRTVPLDAELTAGETPASIDPDSVPPDTPGLGREAARRLHG